MRIYVGNLSYESTEGDIRTAFENFGAVEEIAIIQDKFSGRSKGFCFVEMPDDAEAQMAIDGMNGQEILGRQVRVNTAHPKGHGQERERPARDGGSNSPGY